MGGKGGGAEEQPTYTMTAPEPEPIIIEFPEMPEPTYEEPIDYVALEEEKRNEREQKKKNLLKKGRQDTIHSSPIGDTDEAEIKKKQLLGG